MGKRHQQGRQESVSLACSCALFPVEFPSSLEERRRLSIPMFFCLGHGTRHELGSPQNAHPGEPGEPPGPRTMRPLSSPRLWA